MLITGCLGLDGRRYVDPVGLAPGTRFVFTQDVLLARNGLLKPCTPAEIEAYRGNDPDWSERRHLYRGVVQKGSTVEYEKAVAIPEVNTGAIVQYRGRLCSPPEWRDRHVLLEALLFPSGRQHPHSTNFLHRL